jgi:hypothetical protein
MASSIVRWSGWVAPCSERSEAIRTSGLPAPDATSPQPYAVRGPSVVRPSTLTHAAPAPAASAWGGPTDDRAVTLLERGSTRATVPSM